MVQLALLLALVAPVQENRYYFSFDKVPDTFHSANKQFTAKANVNPDSLVLSDSSGRQIWRIKFPQDAPPIQVRITNDGAHVVLYGYYGGGFHGDKYGNFLRLVFLGPKGEVLKGYRDWDYVTEEKVAAVPGTMSFDPKEQELHFYGNPYAEIGFGALFKDWKPQRYSLATGERLPVNADVEKSMRGQLVQRVRKNLVSPSVRDRESALFLVKELKDEASLPAVRRLTRDRAECVQDAAFDALGALRPKEAVSIARGMLAKEKVPKRSILLLDKIHDNGGKINEQLLVKLSKSKDQEVIVELSSRFGSYRLKSGNTVEQLLGTQANTYQPPREEMTLAKARKLIHDKPEAKDYPESSIEDITAWREAADFLYRNGTLEDLPLLTSMLKTSYENLALARIIELNPPNLEELLIQAAEVGTEMDAGGAAMMELAIRGNATYQEKVLAWLKGLSGREKPHFLVRWRDEVEELFKALIKTKPDALREALQPCLTIQEADFDLHVRGALAVLGDDSLLPWIRVVAGGIEPDSSPVDARLRGHPYRRIDAIQWLVRAKDKGSLPALKALTTTKDESVAEVAREAVKLLEGG